MKNKIELFAAEHLEMYSEVVKWGIGNNSSTFNEFSKATSHSPIYAHLAQEELIQLAMVIDTLKSKAENGNIEVDFGVILDLQLYPWRASFFNKLALEALERDKENPNRVHDDSFFNIIKSGNDSQKLLIKSYSDKSLTVLELMFGLDWKKSQTNMIGYFENYISYWTNNETFRQIEADKLIQ
jgi:hypothetical protein